MKYFILCITFALHCMASAAAPSFEDVKQVAALCKSKKKCVHKIKEIRTQITDPKVLKEVDKLIIELDKK